MGLWNTVRGRLKARKRRKTRDAIFVALDEARRAAVRREITVDDRVVIFSDHHKGARDGADDFQRCERAYNAALVYYHYLGWHLVELGDVEELWENTISEVTSNYPETLRLAAAFQADGRYTRFYGNHDLAWQDAELFAENMAAHGYAGVAPLGSQILAVKDASGRVLGELLLVHGHQGTADSDRHARSSEFFVHRAWRPVQALLNRPWNTPSVDWRLGGDGGGGAPPRPPAGPEPAVLLQHRLLLVRRRRHHRHRDRGRRDPPHPLAGRPGHGPPAARRSAPARGRLRAGEGHMTQAPRGGR